MRSKSNKNKCNPTNCSILLLVQNKASNWNLSTTYFIKGIAKFNAIEHKDL